MRSFQYENVGFVPFSIYASVGKILNFKHL
jgi:hypothetical protein